MRHPVRSTLAVLAACAALTTAHAADRVKVGMLSTLSGPGAGLGIDIRDGFNLALKHTGGKLGGLPAEVVIADDQASPDAAKQTTDRLLKRDRVDFMTGVVFSNVMLAVGQPIFDAKTCELLGAHLAGAEVTELIQGFVVAMNCETTEEELMHTIFPHPTLSETMKESVLDAYGRVLNM